jgi:hypothetical protein
MLAVTWLLSGLCGLPSCRQRHQVRRQDRGRVGCVRVCVCACVRVWVCGCVHTNKNVSYLPLTLVAPLTFLSLSRYAGAATRLLAWGYTASSGQLPCLLLHLPASVFGSCHVTCCSHLVLWLAVVLCVPSLSFFSCRDFEVTVASGIRFPPHSLPLPSPSSFFKVVCPLRSPTTCAEPRVCSFTCMLALSPGPRPAWNPVSSPPSQFISVVTVGSSMC